MSEWQPIETAPKDGDVFLAYWRDEPVFVAWIAPSGSVRTVGHLWWKRRISEAEEGGYRVVTYSPRAECWVICGNYAPFTPSAWMPLPQPPVA